jgi:hypothetical protein
MIYMADALIDHRKKNVVCDIVIFYLTSEKGFQVTLDRKCYFCERVFEHSNYFKLKAALKKSDANTPSRPPLFQEMFTAKVSIA